MNGFAQTALHKLTNVKVENLAGLRVEQQRVVKSLPSNAVKPNGKSLANVNEDANYYLDYVDLPYGLDFQRDHTLLQK